VACSFFLPILQVQAIARHTLPAPWLSGEGEGGEEAAAQELYHYTA
jgi:hypothetical protein